MTASDLQGELRVVMVDLETDTEYTRTGTAS